MSWIELSVTVDSIALDAVSEMLMRHGSSGVSIEDGNSFNEDMKQVNWDYIDENVICSSEKACIKAYYQNDEGFKEILSEIKHESSEIKQIFDLSDLDIETKVVEESDWQNEWKKYYKPFRIGEKILITPSWEETEVKNDDVLIELDPGMAFGTGTHESTKMCAELLEKYLENRTKLLDIGCGSGILSIIGAKLGCEQVTSIDIDETAIKTTNENTKINKVENKISAKVAKLEELQNDKYQVICANIVADVLIGITPLVTNFLDENGIYIISGIILERKNEVDDILIKCGLKKLEEKTMGEWVAIAAVWENSL